MVSNSNTTIGNEKRTANRTQMVETDRRGLPNKEILINAFLAAHACRGGKELHIQRDGTTTIEGIPLMEYFPAARKNKCPINGIGGCVPSLENVFRLENGVWKLGFDNTIIQKVQNSIGLRYCHALIARPLHEIPAWRLAIMVHGEPEDVVEEKYLLDGYVATYEVPISVESGDTVERVLDTEFWDEVYCSEDRVSLLNALERMKEDAEVLRQKGKVSLAVELHEEAVQLEDWLRKNLPRERTDSAYFPSRSRRDAKSVSIAIKRAIQKLEPKHPALAQHLHDNLETGFYCCYWPQKPIHWSL